MKKNLIEEIDKFAEPAVAGSNGQKVAFKVACNLWRNSADDNEVQNAFAYYNSKKCVPPFNEKEVARILASAKNAVGKDVGKYDKRVNSSNSTSHIAPTAPQATIEIRPHQTPLNSVWSLTANRLLDKCQDDYPTKNSPITDWIVGRGIDPIFAYGVGVGYCMGNKSGFDYKLSATVFNTNKEASIYVGYTLPIRNEKSELVGLVFIRPKQLKQYRYMMLSGSRLLPYGVDWLRFKSESSRIVIIVEGTFNWLSLLQTIGGHYIYDKKVVVIGLPHANTSPDEGTLSLLQKSDVILLITDSDDAGLSCREKWYSVLTAQNIATIKVDYPVKADTKIDANDLLLTGELFEWINKKLFTLHTKKII